MVYPKDKKYYFRNFQIALVLSLALVISAFIFFPEIQRENPVRDLQESFVILIEDIPATSQSGLSSKKKKPLVPKIIIAAEIEEPEILNDIEIKRNVIHAENIDENEGGEKNNASNLSGGIINPRQILEVLPKEKNNFKGRINLSLKVNSEGEVTAHKILSNTTNSEQCLEEVLRAAYKSKWEPFLNDRNELWVEKSYSFN